MQILNPKRDRELWRVHFVSMKAAASGEDGKARRFNAEREKAGKHTMTS